MTKAALHIHADELAAIENALWCMASEPGWNLGMLMIERVKTRILSNLPEKEAQAFVRITMAPIALKASETQLEHLRRRIKVLETSVNGAHL